MENTPQNNEVNSLESSGAAAPDPLQTAQPKKQGVLKRVQGAIAHVNIYLLLFILIIVLAGGLVFIGIQNNKKIDAPTNINTQPLTAEQLAQLQGTEAKVGDPKQTLSIESNTVFSGKVLVRDSLDVAGTIKVGGALNLPGITVSGTSTFDQIQGNRLAIAGDANVNGQLTVLRNISVTGGASFGGPISAPHLVVQTMQLNSDLQLNRHIDTGGPTPGVSNGSALGNGGTVSLSGADTAGTVTMNVGGSPGAGCFATVTFTTRFNGTPHIVITPIGSAAAGLNYYVNRSSTNFSICTTNPAPAGQTFSFDYVAID